MQYPVRNLLSCGLALSVLASGLSAGEPQKIAVVNVSFVFENYQKVADIQRRIDAKHDARKKELEASGKMLADQNRQLEDLSKQAGAGASEQLFDAVQALRRKQFQYERAVSTLNGDIQKDYAREMREVLSDIRQSIRANAEANGFAMVLRSPDTDDPEVVDDSKKMKDPADNKTYLQLQKPKSTMEVLERFNRNPVLFGATTVDITGDVVKVLNGNFMRRKIQPDK